MGREGTRGCRVAVHGAGSERIVHIRTSSQRRGRTEENWPHSYARKWGHPVRRSQPGRRRKQASLAALSALMTRIQYRPCLPSFPLYSVRASPPVFKLSED